MIDHFIRPFIDEWTQRLVKLSFIKVEFRNQSYFSLQVDVPLIYVVKKDTVEP